MNDDWVLWHNELKQVMFRGSKEMVDARRKELNERYQTGAYESKPVI